MGSPKTGRFGKLQAPLNDGIQYSNVALTLSASKTIGGQVLTNRFFGHTAKYWNKNPTYKASFRVQGIVGTAEIQPGSANDKISIKAAFSYYADNGAVKTSAAPSDVSATRPAAGKAAWYLVCVTLADGTITVEKGKEVTGTRTSLLNTFGDPSSGSDGAIPLIAATKTIVGAFKLDSDSAAMILSSDITYVDGNGRLLQERSDIPAGKENLLDGGVVVDEALLPAHTGDTPRKIYASFYSQETALSDVADLIDWKISGQQSAVSMPGKGNNPTASEIGSAPTFSGSASKYMTGRGMYDLFLKGAGFLKLYQDSRDTTEYYECACVWTSFDENNDASPIKNGLQFSVDGYLERRGTS